MELIKFKTDEKSRFGKSIQTSAGILTFDENGIVEINKNTATILIEDGYTDPYPVDVFNKVNGGEFVDSEGDDEVMELTKESILTLTKKQMQEIAESQGFDDAEWKSLNTAQLKDYLTKKFFPVE